MDTRTGKLYLNPSDQEIVEKQLRMLESNEYSFLKGLPEEERPVQLALHDYCKSRNRVVTLHEKVAFRLGFEAGRKSAL